MGNNQSHPMSESLLLNAIIVMDAHAEHIPVSFQTFTKANILQINVGIGRIARTDPLRTASNEGVLSA